MGTISRILGSVLLAALPIALVGCGGGEGASAAEAGGTGGAAVSRHVSGPAGPTAGDLEFERITADWPDETFERCGRGLREVLGTRDLVQGAFDQVLDPRGKATAEIEDARHWLELGDSEFASVLPALENGVCDSQATVVFDQTLQYYIKAGTAAVQAGQVASS